MLKLYNSMSRSKEAFKPMRQNIVKVFTCGPSIYKRPHIGNYRTFLYEDVLIKYLEYLGFKVKRIINFTDVEDKAIREAGRIGKEVADVVDDSSQYFFSEAKILKIKLPPKIPASSTCVDQAVSLIQVLLEKGVAYWYKGSVFFDPLKYEGFGKLFRLDMSKWPKKKKRYWKDNYDGNHWHRGDFILWHGYKEGSNPFWETAIGRGRPSWHIQDPAIIYEHLGESIDINCGGIDNIFRHHDYNIAVMESVTGKQFARFFLHGEHLIVNGRTMSKSKGNIVYPDHIIGDDILPAHLRFFLIYTPYRQKLNFTENKFKKASEYLDAYRAAARNLTSGRSYVSETNKNVDGLIKRIKPAFEEKMDDDLDVRGAFDCTREILEQLASYKEQSLLTRENTKAIKDCLKDIDLVLGVIF